MQVLTMRDTAILQTGYGRSCTIAFPELPEKRTYIPVVLDLEESAMLDAIRLGVDRAAEEFNLTVEYLTDSGGDGKRYSRNMQSALAKNPQAMCVWPSDTKTLTSFLHKTNAAEIPVIGLNPSLSSQQALSGCGSWNGYAAGRSGAERILALLEETEDAVLGVIYPAAQNAELVSRTEGFNEVLAGAELSPIVLQLLPEADLADQVSVYLGSNPPMDALFCFDELTLLALVDLSRTSDLHSSCAIAGFGDDTGIVQAVQAGVITGSYARDYVSLGYRTMTAALRCYLGGKVESDISVDYFWVDVGTVKSEKARQNFGK